MQTLFVCTLLWQSALSAAPSSDPGPPEGKVDAASQQEIIERLTHNLEKIDRAVGETKLIIRISLDAPYLPDLYFHLAELYVERSRFEHQKGLTQQGDGKRMLSEDRSMVVQLSKKLAIETYEKILIDFPEYERRDQIYFFKGHEYRELGEWPPMFKEYNALIEKYPRSKWALEARLILGDHYFDKAEYDSAEEYYKDILLQAESQVHPMARYKMGWIRVNQQNWREALELFKDAVQSAGRAERDDLLPGGSRRVNIKHEALMAMAWPYSEVKKPSEALAYFRSLADSKANYLDALKRLASRYDIKSRSSAAALIYREIVRWSSDAEQNLAYLPHIVNAVQDLPDDKAVRYLTVEQDVKGLTDTLIALMDRPVATKKRPDAPTIDEAKIGVDFELHARDLATRAHKFAQSAEDIKLEKLAAKAYAYYLEAFPKAREYSTIELDRAGALYDGKEFLAAGLQYEKAASGPDNRSKAREQDIYNAITAYYQALDEDTKHRQADSERDGTLNKLQLVRAREGLKHLGTYYIKKYPNSNKVPDVRFNIARMYYQQGSFLAAVDLFVEFINKYPTHKDVGTAGRLALDALYKLEKLDELATLAERFAKDKRIADSDFQAEALRLSESARRRKIEYAVIGTSDSDFGAKMVSEWQKHKGTQEGENYLYAGFTKFKEASDIANTLAFGDKLMGAYPNSKWAPEVVATMGNFAAQVADFERAAWMYEEYQRRYPKERSSADLLQNAGDIRTLLGEGKQAEQDFSTLRQIGNSEQKNHGALKLLEMYAGSAAWGQLRVAANAFVNEAPSVSACFYAGLAALNQDDMREAKQHLACAVRGTPQSDVEDTLQARAAFELARVTHAAYTALTFRGAASASQILRQKLQLLNDTEQAYLGTVRGGDSRWALAATYELSRLYRDFGAFIISAPAPANVSASEYKTALEGQAEPYFDRAKQTLSACSQKAEQLRLLTAYGAACANALDKEVEERVGMVPRSASAQDPKYQQDMDKLRQQLAKRGKSVEIRKNMVRRALLAKDYHYARLILGSLAEDGGSGHFEAWTGLIAWHLGDSQTAAEELEVARRAGNDTAGLNLAALYYSYGYKRLAKQVLPDASKMQNIDANSPEVHPSARRLLKSSGEGSNE